MSQAAYYNGYDDGYAAAKKELGSAGESSSGESSSGGRPDLQANSNAIQAIQNDHSFRVAVVSNSLSAGKKLNVLDVRSVTDTTWKFYENGQLKDEFCGSVSGARNNASIFEEDGMVNLYTRGGCGFSVSEDDGSNSIFCFYDYQNSDSIIGTITEFEHDESDASSYTATIRLQNGTTIDAFGYTDGEAYSLGGYYSGSNYSYWDYGEIGVGSELTLYSADPITTVAVKDTATFTEPASVSVPAAGDGDILVWMHCPTGYGTTVSPVSFTGATLNGSMPSAAGDYLVVLGDNGTSYNVSVEDRSETT